MRPATAITLTVTVPASLSRALADFERNGRWGTCSGCPDDPAQCEDFDRTDHRLTNNDLDEAIGFHVRKTYLTVSRAAPAAAPSGPDRTAGAGPCPPR